MYAKSGLRVVLKWEIYRPDSVITAVIPLAIIAFQIFRIFLGSGVRVPTTFRFSVFTASSVQKSARKLTFTALGARIQNSELFW